MDCRQAPCQLPGMETRSPDDFELFLELILEAPRGQREVFPNKQYRPAWMNDPSADKFPCGGAGGQCSGSGGNGRCAKGGSCQSGCGNGSCGTATWTPPPPLAIISLDADKGKAISLIGQIAHDHPRLPTLVISGDNQVILQALQNGAKYFLTQPVVLEDMLVALRKVQRESHQGTHTHSG